jgi:hypothetical protein
MTQDATCPVEHFRFLASTALAGRVLVFGFLEGTNKRQLIKQFDVFIFRQ